MRRTDRPSAGGGQWVRTAVRKENPNHPLTKRNSRTVGPSPPPAWQQWAPCSMLPCSRAQWSIGWVGTGAPVAPLRVAADRGRPTDVSGGWEIFHGFGTPRKAESAKKPTWTPRMYCEGVLGWQNKRGANSGSLMGGEVQCFRFTQRFFRFFWVTCVNTSLRKRMLCTNSDGLQPSHSTTVNLKVPGPFSDWNAGSSLISIPMPITPPEPLRIDMPALRSPETSTRKRDRSAGTPSLGLQKTRKRKVWVF